MRPALACLLPLMLAACAQGTLAPRPERVSVLSNQLTVHFSNGTRCSADLAQAMAGQLPACAQTMGYAVELHHPVWLTGAEALMEPYTTITLTRTSDGRVFSFTTPGEAYRRTMPNYGRPSG